MRFSAILSLLLLALLCGPAAAQGERITTAHVDKIEIFEHGLYESQMSRKIKAPDAPGGFVTEEVNIDHVQTTDVIPAELEVQFGFWYTIVGAPTGASVPITQITRFPAPGLKDPSKAKPMLSYQSSGTLRVGQDNFDSYSFDELWEVVPGVWTFEIWSGNKKLAEKKFTVIAQ